MPLPQLIRPDMDPCELTEKWQLEEELARRLIWMAGQFYNGRVELRIISGYRSPDYQEEVSPTPANLSNHTLCPSRAADLDPVLAIDGTVKAELGRAARLAGLRWGGGAPVDSAGIPVDPEWRHVDLGPRPS